MKIITSEKEKKLALQPPNGSEHLSKRARTSLLIITYIYPLIHSQYISITNRYQIYKRRVLI